MGTWTVDKVNAAHYDGAWFSFVLPQGLYKQQKYPCQRFSP